MRKALKSLLVFKFLITTLIRLIRKSFSIPSIGRMTLEPPDNLSKGILDKKSRKNLPPTIYLLAISFPSYISSPVLAEMKVVLKLMNISMKKDRSIKDSITVMPIVPRISG